MITKNFLGSVNLLCKRQNKYYAKRYVHRQLLSKMFPSFGATVASSCVSATGSLSQKASQLLFYVLARSTASAVECSTVNDTQSSEDKPTRHRSRLLLVLFVVKMYLS